METLSLSYLMDYFALRWNHGETIDNYFLRAEMTYQRFVNHCGVGISPAGKAYLLVQQLHIRPEDLVQLLRYTRGHLPTTEAELETMKRTFTQFLKITKPHLLTRTFTAEEQAENTTDTYIIDGEVLSASIPETAARLEPEVRHLRQSSPSVIPYAYQSKQDKVFALDAEDPDDGEI